ncbi:MFS transporter [Nocardiopsis potens]|uniref:MFS transporter n=1 Tax=Nocardiopsis potens TaxID=1246458 RepID=UPI00034C18E1|nr:MFS transporter [Nocardiopsis potens]
MAPDDPRRSTADRAGGRAGRPAVGAVLALACTAQFMVVLDVSVVNVALPSIRAALDFGPADLQWVAGAYALAFAGLLLLGGRLADLYGCRRVLIAGLALFTAASLAGGAAWTPGLLIAARAAQGLGAAVLAPATLTVLTATFPDGPARTRALATWTAVGAAGGAAGNLVGGLLTDSLSWRAILLVNVPVGIAAIAAAARFTARDRRPAGGPGRLDVPGAVAATAGVTALTYGVTRVPEHGWTDPATAAALAAGGAALALFAAVEARFAAAPLVPPRLLRDRAVAVGCAVTLLAGACFQIPMWYFLTLYMQDVLGYGALATGLGFLPHTLVTVAAGRWLTPLLMRRADARALVAAGALIAAAGFAWQAAAVPAGTYAAAVLGPGLLFSLGGGLFATPLTAIVVSGADPSDAGAASGLLNTAKQAGGALGLAVLVTLAGPVSGAAGYGGVFQVLAGLQLAVAAAALALPARRPR